MAERNRWKRNNREIEEKSELERALDDPHLKRLYLKEVEKFLKGNSEKGRGREEDNALKGLRLSLGTDNFQQNAIEYINNFGIPDDWSVILSLMDIDAHSDIVVKAIERAEQMFGQKGQIEQNAFLSKLKILSMTSNDPDISEYAEEVIEKLC